MTICALKRSAQRVRGTVAALLVSVTLATTAVAISQAPEAAAATAAPKITTTTAPMYAGAASTTTRLYLVPQGITVTATGYVSGSYSQVLYGGRYGYILTSYLRASSVATATAAYRVKTTAVNYAKSKVGSPYTLSGTGPAYDCSGLVKASYAAAGVTVRHSMATESTLGRYVPATSLAPGDVVSWGTPVSAVSIYVGNGQLVMADGFSAGVRYVSLASRMSWATFAGGRRYVG